MIPNVGPLELVVILVIALVVLGPKRLPEVGKSLGKGLREFKASLDNDDDLDERPAHRPPLEARATVDRGDRHPDAPGDDAETHEGVAPP
jgi:sec-independent protein translocase protein TatA